jgi:hypothetical protein
MKKRREQRRGTVSEGDFHMSQSTISSYDSNSSLDSMSSSSSFDPVYGSRISAKQGGANASKDDAAGVYRNENGETFLIKSDEKKPQKDIGEYLTAVVYQALAPEHGAQVDLIKHTDSRPFLASKFKPGYIDFHKVFGDKKRARVGETVSAAVKKQDDRAVYRELGEAMTGGGYNGYPESMIPAMIAGEFARHSGNFGLVPNKDGTFRLVSIDFGAAARKEHFGPTIELDTHLPDTTIVPGVDMGEKNYYKKDHPQELLYTAEFAGEADRMASEDVTKRLEDDLKEAWVKIESSFDEKTIKAFGEQMGVSEEKLASANYKSEIKAHYIDTIKARQQSMKKQFGTEARERNLNDPNFKINGEQLKDALCKKEYGTKAARERSKKALQDALESKSEVDVKAICEASGSSKHPKNLKRINALIDEMAKDPEINYDMSIKLVKIKNRICAEHINKQVQQGKLKADSPELLDLAKNIQGIKGDVEDQEIKKIIEKLPLECAAVIGKHITRNIDLKLDPQQRLLEEGAYKLYSEGYRDISFKKSGATPGFKCIDPEGKACIVKTGKAGRDTSEVISEDLACKVGKVIFGDPDLQAKYGAPAGLSVENIPDTSLLQVNTFSFVKSVFLSGFKDLHKTLGQDTERARLKSRTRVREITGALTPEQKKELCWLLAFRHVIGDKDGHTSNFGLMTGKDGQEHVCMIDCGLANHHIVEDEIDKGTFKKKELLGHKLTGAASPNHLADYVDIYKHDPEFKKATEAMKGIFCEKKAAVRETINSSILEAIQVSGPDAVKGYGSNWCKFRSGVNVGEALSDQYEYRAGEIAKVTKGMQEKYQLKEETKKLSVFQSAAKIFGGAARAKVLVGDGGGITTISPAPKISKAGVGKSSARITGQ